jgi:hypothetical protein
MLRKALVVATILSIPLAARAQPVTGLAKSQDANVAEGTANVGIRWGANLKRTAARHLFMFRRW